MDDPIEKDLGPSPDRTATLPMDAHHRLAEECVTSFGGRIGHCFRSAFDHLRRSWSLHPVDSEMALFRAITAEEEAATALILALKQRGYDGVGSLNPRNHVHKAAVSPFLDAVNNLLVSLGVPAPRLTLQGGDRPQLMVTIDLAALTRSPEPQFGEIDQPFNYLLTKGGQKAAYLFDQELQALATSSGEASIEAFVKREANLRNRLLYASDDGIPQANFNDLVILKRRDRVYRIALIAIGILQTPQRQLFATQCLQAYKAAVGQIAVDTFDYDHILEPEGVQMTIVQQPDGSYAQSATYRKTATLTFSGRWLPETRVNVHQPPAGD